MSAPKVRVLHMGLDDRRGGIESFLFNAACNIDQDRFQFDYLCYGDDPAFGDELSDMGAALIKMPDRRNVLAYVNFLNRELSRGYDVLHLHKNSPGDFLPVLVARRYPTKTIVHAHNTAANKSVPDVIGRLGRDVFNRYADGRLACSTSAGEFVFGAGSAFEFVPNAILLSDYAFDPQARDELRASLGIGVGTFVVGVVGRLVEQKNYPFMVRAFAYFHDECPDSLLVCVGEGERRDEIRLLAAELGVRDAVMLLGRRDDTARLYSAFDVACCPSVYEGFSYFTLEAQAAGLQCLVSEAVPPEARVTSHVQVLGLDETLWARELLALAESGRPRGALSGDGVSAMQAFDVASLAQRLMGIYERLVTNRKVKR